MVRRILAGSGSVLLMTLLAQPAAAQTGCGIPSSGAPTRADRWGGSFEIGAAPRIGDSRPLDATSDIVDESEGWASVAISRKGRGGLTNAELKAGVTTSPQLLDEQAPASATYIQATLGDAEIPFYWNTGPADAGYCAEQLAPDSFRPYANYRWTRRYDDFLQMRSRDDHRVAVGIRYRDVRAVMELDDSPTRTQGVYLEASAEVVQVWSTNDAKDLLQPGASVTLASRPLFGTSRILGGTRLYARAQGDLMFYDSARAPDGRKREDERLRLAVGLNMSGWTRRLAGPLSASVEVQYQRQWSNEPEARSSRWYLVPTVTLGTKL